MPNWCANRLMFSGIQNSDALKTWIAGGELSLHRRARKEGIQLFLAGCAGILRPLTEQHYAPYPQLVSYGAAADNRPSVQAYSDWLAMFMAGAVLDVETCQKLHQCWLDSHIGHARWASPGDISPYWLVVLLSAGGLVVRTLWQGEKLDPVSINALVSQVAGMRRFGCSARTVVSLLNKEVVA